MTKRIKYDTGQKIHECVYLNDVNPSIFPSGKKERKASFICRCGEKFTAIIKDVKQLKTTSCGCENRRIAIEKFTTHGRTKHRLYNTWSNIKKRCYNKNDARYPGYGGREIKMCDEWKNDFKAFYDYVTQLPHYGEPGHTLDRYPDNDGNYEPGNVRWATVREQNTNQRRRTDNKTGYTGVYKIWNRYKAMIYVYKEKINLGTHSIAEQAAIARDKYIIDNELWEYPLQILKDPRTKA